MTRHITVLVDLPVQRSGIAWCVCIPLGAFIGFIKVCMFFPFYIITAISVVLFTLQLGKPLPVDIARRICYNRSIISGAGEDAP